MLTRVRLRRFKTFEQAEIELGQSVLFVGPNNQGKTSALQALALWHFGCRAWLSKHGVGEVTSKRPGITLNRKDLVGLPVSSALMLWNDLHVREAAVFPNGKKGTKNVLIEITVFGVTEGKTWECGFEFDYANPEAFYCRPLKLENNERLAVPPAVERVNLAFLPPMSGLTASETRLPEGRIDVLIGEGRTAEVLRNLCYRVMSENPPAWFGVRDRLRQLFGVTLNDPKFDPARGEISLSYEDGGVSLDIQCAGRGLQQTLLLLAHMEANPGAVLLLDEPDAHLEILRQREIYNVLTDSARRSGGQIVAASHSEVLLNEAADRDVVVSFVMSPKRIDDRGAQVAKALKEIGFEQYIQAEQNKRVFYFEGSTDLSMLREFAKLIGHPLRDNLERPFVHYVGNQVTPARSHYHGLRHAVPDLRGVVVMDKIENPPQEDGLLPVYFWQRREFENYLMFPEILIRYASSLATERAAGPLFEADFKGEFGEVMDRCIRRRITPAALEDRSEAWWSTVKATDDFLDPVFDEFFTELKLPNLMRKSDYHTLVRFIEPEEVHQDVRTMLDDCLRAIDFD